MFILLMQKFWMNLGFAYIIVGDLSSAQMNLTSSLNITRRCCLSRNNHGVVLASTD